MNATLRQIVIGLATVILFVGPALSQETPPPDQEQPTDQDAAASKAIQWLKTYPKTELQFENSLGILLHSSLVSSNDLGVDVADLQPALRAQLNLPEGTGLVVTAAPEDSPGGKGGMKPHDVLLKVGDAAVGNTEQLAEALKKSGGKPVRVELLRQGKARTLDVTPKSPKVAEIAFSDAPVTAWSRIDATREPRYRIGVVLSEADDTLRAQVGLAADEGLIVTEVFPDAPAAKGGIQPHDVLVILDGKRLTTVDAINAQIQEIAEREVEVKLLRSGKELTLRIAPAKEAAAEFKILDRQPLTIWSAGSCPMVVQSSNCVKCHQNPNQFWNHGVLRDYAALPQWVVKQPAQAGSPQEQVNQLKEQLAKLQQTLTALEASLAAEKDKPAESPNRPEGKK